MTEKDYYRNYRADPTLWPLNHKLIELILSFQPSSVFEFGCGTGKNLLGLPNPVGLDISYQNLACCFVNKLPNVVLGDETMLPHLANFDVVFTCSVLNHIMKIDEILTEFKRICKKVVVLAETNSREDALYHRHEYEGFSKLPYSYFSPPEGGDGCTYEIWMWKK